MRITCRESQRLNLLQPIVEARTRGMHTYNTTVLQPIQISMVRV